jgi:hypothetical protein
MDSNHEFMAKQWSETYQQLADGQDKLLQSHAALKADLDIIRDEIKLNHQVLDDALVKYLASFGERLGAIERKLDGELDWPQVTAFLTRNQFSAIANENLPVKSGKSNGKRR